MNIIKISWALLRGSVGTTADRALEILALQQQLAVYQRQNPKPKLRWRDRRFWVWLSWLWPGWRSALVVVKPETVVRWHQRGFAWF